MTIISPIIYFSPDALEISDHVQLDKIGSFNDVVKKFGHEPIVVLADNDGTFYVADGNTRAIIDRSLGRSVPGIIVDDSHKLGPQTAIDRVCGIFFIRKEG